MVRVLALACLALLIIFLVRAAVAAFIAGYRGSSRHRGTPRALQDELVKDPVCETYVPRRSAITRAAGPATYYFCSPGCAKKFKVPS